MKRIIFILAITITTNFIYSQSWKYESGENPFDGKYRTASVLGKGTNFPFQTPSLVINVFNLESINFYIANAGVYESLSGIEVLWAFSSEPKTIYKSYGFSKSNDGKILFFDNFKGLNSKNYINKLDFIEKLKLGNKVDIRIKNKYGKNDMSFSLTGSNKSINYVISQEYKNKITEEKERIERERIERVRKVKEAKRKSLDALFDGINRSNEKQTNPTSPENKTSNRSVIYQAVPNYKNIGNEQGIVYVEVSVNTDGIVTQAKAGIKGSTTYNKNLLEAAKKAALKTRFSKDLNAPKIQIGILIYNFRIAD